MKKIAIIVLAVCLCVADAFANIRASSAEAIDISNLSIEELCVLQDKINIRLEELGHKVYFDIERGAKGEEVSAIQERLAELGYYTGRITGKYDSETQKAFKSFEKVNNLANDGSASRTDQIVLFDANAVSKVAPTSTPTASANPSGSKNDSSGSSAEFSVEVTSCWAPNTGLNGVTLYTPYLKVRVTNQRGKEASRITIESVFYNETQKELWSDETYYLVGSGEAALRDGYSKTAFIRSSVGYQKKVSDSLLPTITAEIYVNGILYDKITVNNTYE